MPRKLIFAAWMFWMTKMIATVRTATPPMSRAWPLLILTDGLRRKGLGDVGWVGAFPLAKGGGSVLVALGVLVARPGGMPLSRARRSFSPGAELLPRSLFERGVRRQFRLDR